MMTKEKYAGKVYLIFCPSCNKKLMSTKNSREPIIEIFNEKSKDTHDDEMRCPRCKSFVGVNK